MSEEKLKQNVKISVIVPVYNVDRYIRRCVNSIINQSYSNIEIILIDDGSTDESGRICDELANSDPRIIVIHKNNGGLSDARNNGIDAASGEYVVFVDSDDFVHCDYIYDMYKSLILYDADIVTCRYIRGYSNDEEDINPQKSENVIILSGVEALKCMLYSPDLIPVSANMKLYKKELFKDITYPVGRLHEDIGTTYKLLLKAAKVVKLSGQYYYYFQRRTGIVHSKFNVRKMDAIFFAEDMLEYTSKEFPDLISAAKCYLLAQCVQVVGKIPIHSGEFKNEILYIKNLIKKYRHDVIYDKNVDFKKRIGILATYFGLDMVKGLAIIYKRTINNEQV